MKQLFTDEIPDDDVIECVYQSFRILERIGKDKKGLYGKAIFEQHLVFLVQQMNPIKGLFILKFYPSGMSDIHYEIEANKRLLDNPQLIKMATYSTDGYSETPFRYNGFIHFSFNYILVPYCKKKDLASLLKNMRK